LNLSHRPLRTAEPHATTNQLWRTALLTLLSGSGLLTGIVRADRPATFWAAPTGDFFDSTKWSLGAPSSSLDAKIDNGGIASITTASGPNIPYVYLGSAQNTSGTLEVTGGGVANFTTMIVGALNATGRLNILSGGRLTSFGGPIGSDYLGVGVATVDGAGSSWRVTGSEMVVGGNGDGTIRLQNTGNLTVQNGDGRVQLANHPVSEGNLLIGDGGLAGTLSAREIYNGEGRGTVVFNHTNDSLAFAPRLKGLKTVNGFLNVEHNGPGTTILTAVESNLAGTITVAAGTLLVNGNVMGSVTDVLMEDEVTQERTIGTTSVLTGGTLGGSGLIEGKTTVQGTLSPGISAGVLRFGGDLSLESSAVVSMELGGELRGTQFDGVDVAGALLYGGTLRIVLLNGFEPEEGDIFDLFNGFTSRSGTFANIVFSSGTYQGAFQPETGVLTIVPEPSTCGLLALGISALALRRRSKSREVRS
jgi:T5SS/PEP-CTERM-associated repeat protein